jgi:class 3 adenylate cyclase
LIDPLIDQHRGRIFKTTGDGMLIEFASVVDAVRCAVVVQRGLEDRNANLQEAERIRLRIGINLGDVMIDEGDVFGDGVNVAARIEALAAPARSALATRCASRSAKSCRSGLPISVSTASRTSRGRSAFTASRRERSLTRAPRRHRPKIR